MPYTYYKYTQNIQQWGYDEVLATQELLENPTPKKSNLSHTDYKSYSMFGHRLEVSIVQEMLYFEQELYATSGIIMSDYKS